MTPLSRRVPLDGFVSYTVGAGGSWIAWLTETKPAANATARDLASSPGRVQFAIGATGEAALARLEMEVQADLLSPVPVELTESVESPPSLE